MEVLKTLHLTPPDGISTTTSSDELLTLKINAFNAQKGNGVCSECNGKGYIAEAREGQMVMRECSCMAKIRTLNRVRRSRLGELYERYTMDSYTTERPWQKVVKSKALAYIEAARGWFYVCGRSGSGKTHITCAIVRELIDAGMEARYMMWRQDAPRLKALVNDRERYDEMMWELIDVKVLLIDDLWKGSVTDADINLTFELINARYNSPSKLTIISSEKTIEQVLSIDEAIGGRIVERARGFVLQTGAENVRLGGC